MSQSVHCISRSIPSYGPSDSSSCFPCSGVSARVVTVSSCFHSSVYKRRSQGKIAPLKCATMEASFACRADSRRNQDFSKQNRHGFSRGRGKQSGERYVSEILDESELLSSKNGPVLSLSGNPKFQATAAPGPREKEIVELFRKVQVQLRERAAVKEEKKMEASQGQSKETETVDSLLKLLRKHSVEHGKRNNKHDNSGDGDSSEDFILDQPKQDGSFSEERNSSSSRTNSTVQEESQERSFFGRPVSNFRRKSPVPRTKSMPSFSDKAIVNSVSHLKSGEYKRPGLADTVLEPELEPEFMSSFSDNATANSVSHLDSGEYKRPGLADTDLELESEPESELELDLELEPESEPELIHKPEHTFSDELEFDVPENSANDVFDNEDRKTQNESKDLTALKLTELRSLAKSCGIKGFSKMKKAELMEVLSQSAP